MTVRPEGRTAPPSRHVRTENRAAPPAAGQLWRRYALGVFAALLLGAWIYMELRYDEPTSFVETLKNSCLRGGLVVGAFWLAFPQLMDIFARYSPWKILSVFLVGAVLIIRPTAIVFVLPLLLVLAVMKGISWLFQPFPQQHRRPPHKPPEP